MVPQLYITVYKEQFAPPGRAQRAALRPTSAHRRNNPQPRPDFLFPRSIQPNYRSTCTQPHPVPHVDGGRPLFPPVRNLSFHSPVLAFPGNYLNNVDMGKPKHMPPVNPVAEQALPSADRLSSLQEPSGGAEIKLHTALKNPQRRMNYQRNGPPPSAQQLRPHVDAQLYPRPQTSKPPAAPDHFPRTQHHSSGCYSCFHVVKPYQAGHYTIHPEFMSECLC